MHEHRLGNGIDHALGLHMRAAQKPVELFEIQ